MGTERDSTAHPRGARGASTGDAHTRLGRLYDFVTGDEDARVCKDIPPAACRHLPRNFFGYLAANVLNKISDELASARLVLPWMLSALGAPLALAGFLVPIREAGVLVPQLLVAASIRSAPYRKPVWLAGALLSAAALALMALTVATLAGAAAGWAIIAAVLIYSLARGLCSVAAKDVLGKTVSKTRRGALMGYSAAVGGGATLAIGVYIELSSAASAGKTMFVALLVAAAALWLLAAASFAAIREHAGATEGGGNALTAAIKSLDMLRTDRLLRGFVRVRVLLLSVALAPPFYVIVAQQRTGGELVGLGMLIVASGLAASLSAPLWGRLSDRSSRTAMSAAAAAAALLGFSTWALLALDHALMAQPLTYALLFLAIGVAHGGVRLARKVYLVDMANSRTRAAYVAISNTVVGVAILVGGVFGALSDLIGAELVILVLAFLAAVSAAAARRLPEVSG